MEVVFRLQEPKPFHVCNDVQLITSLTLFENALKRTTNKLRLVIESDVKCNKKQRQSTDEESCILPTEYCLFQLDVHSWHRNNFKKMFQLNCSFLPLETRVTNRGKFLIKDKRATILNATVQVHGDFRQLNMPFQTFYSASSSYLLKLCCPALGFDIRRVYLVFSEPHVYRDLKRSNRTYTPTGLKTMKRIETTSMKMT